MLKLILLITVIFLGVIALAGCRQQQSNPLEMSEVPEGKISEYLPITLNDQFILTSNWLYYNYPYAKTYFTESELMIIHRALSSFLFYGFSHPWSDEGILGMPPVLYAMNENHKIAIYFITHPKWGYLALAIFEDGDDADIQKWFTMDSDAFWEITGLIR